MANGFWLQRRQWKRPPGRYVAETTVDYAVKAQLRSVMGKKKLSGKPDSKLRLSANTDSISSQVVSGLEELAQALI